MCRLLHMISVALALGGAASGAADQCIPFVYTDGMIRVEGRARGVEGPLWFLLDSGAAVSVLNRSTADRLGLRDGACVTVKGVGSETTGRWPEKLNASASSVTLPSQYLVVDLRELEGQCAFPVDGLIGADFFEGRVVEIDFKAQRIRIQRESGRRDVDTLPSSIPLKKTRGVWTVTAIVNGMPGQRLRVDTGCATGLHWVSTRAPEAAPVHHSVGLAAVTTRTQTCAVQLGTLEATHVAAALHQKQIFAGEEGLLGNGFLSRFGAVTLDGRSKRLFLGGMSAN
jgi:hypothetical protein